ncbi:hypothetical protein ABBQ32_009478 [Trebouxia sp. C0010 RCD-2024]
MLTRSKTRKRFAEPVSAARSRDEKPRSKKQRVEKQKVESVTMDQMPIAIVARIADKLCRKDQADFRLTCKSWQDAYPIQHRIVLRQTQDWEDAAKEVRRLCQEAVIVVQTACVPDLPQLLPSLGCDKVSLDTRPGWASQWSLEPMYYVPDRIKEVLIPLGKVLDIPKEVLGRDKLELQMRIRSTQAASEALRSALKGLASNIFQLRVLESLTYFSKQIFPLTGIKVLAFSLPYRWENMPQFQAAIRCLPRLRELQLYLWTANSTKHANLFLEVLQEAPLMTSLRVGARHFPLTLMASSLIHITNLELSWKVTLDHRPPQLKYLCLQCIKPDAATADRPFDGYAPLFLELAKSDLPVEMFVNEFSNATLLELPRQLRCLTLVQNVAKPIYKGTEPNLEYQPALKQFSMLKMLQLGDFLSDDLMFVLDGICMPQLTTFGFYMDVYCEGRKKYNKFLNGESVWFPSAGVYKLAESFPALRQFKVVYKGMSKETHVLDARFMSKAIFPRLQGVTCCSEQLVIVFRNLSPSCYLVNKYENQYF